MKTLRESILEAVRETPMTDAELAERLCSTEAEIATATAQMFFEGFPRGPATGGITCGRDGRVRPGDPTPLWRAS